MFPFSREERISVRILKSTAAVFTAAAAMVLGSGLGTAAASQAQHATHSDASPRAAVCEDAAVSGHTVRGALSRNEVRRELSSLTARHRTQRGLPAKGPLGEPGSRLRVDIHPAQGTAFKEADGADGACATQSVSTGLTVGNAATTIYTPTLYPPGGSCVELVTVYTRSVRAVSAWDWCRSVSFEASVNIDDAFVNTYTGGSGAYTGRVIRTDAGSNTWSAQLYNHSTGQWDELFSQSGTNQSGRNDGWDIDELYSTVGSDGQAYSCADRAGVTFESSNISVRNNGTWSSANASNADTHYDQPDDAFYCPSRDYQMVSAYDHWKAVG